ncbi:BH3-interacting domain death agonist [Lissotriton helveticus]
MESNMSTELVLLSFLQCRSCSDEFTRELNFLDSELKAANPPFPDGLMDGDLQTDGNQYSRPGYRSNLPVEDSEADVCITIAHRLALMGDEIDSRIQQEVVDNLVNILLDDNLSQEDKDVRFCTVIDNLVVNVPAGLELEKAKLLLAMILARKVSCCVPGLLRRVFWRTVDFINHHIPSSIDYLARQDNV